MIDINNNILKSFTNISVDDFIEKGKKANIGEIREWNGEKWKKMPDGWVRVSDGKKEKVKDENDISDSQVKEQSNKKYSEKRLKDLGINDGHLFSNVREQLQTSGEFESKIKSILESKDLTKPQKIVELFKNGLSIGEIINTSGATLSSSIDYVIQAKNKGAFSEALDKQQSSSNSNKQETKDNSKNEAKSKPEEKDEFLEFDDDDLLPELSVEERWDTYTTLGTMIAMRKQRAMLAFGSGGVGKTYELLDPQDGVFSKMGLRKADIIPSISEDYDDDLTGGYGPDASIGYDPNTKKKFLKKDKYDYITVTGKITGAKMFQLLQEHNGKIIVFDDCDNVLQKGNEDAQNVLKGALDTSGDGTISWESRTPIKSQYSGIKGATETLQYKDVKTPMVDEEGNPMLDKKGNQMYKKEQQIVGWDIDLPKTFKFTGQVVFISNMKEENIPQPLRSRSLTCDLTMNAQETLQKIEKISKFVKFKNPDGERLEVSDANRQNTVEFMRKYLNYISEADLNMRTFQKIAQIYQHNSTVGSNTSSEKMAIALLNLRRKK